MRANWRMSKCDRGSAYIIKTAAVNMAEEQDLDERYRAAMVLSGAGDALGYKNGEWEFTTNGNTIHEELKKLGGLEKLDVHKWRVSDDTVLHLATGEALVTEWKTTEELFLTMAGKYKKGINEDMWDRAPGATTTAACYALKPLRPKGYYIPFNLHGGGCGAAMRSMCIGLLYPDEENLDKLIEISVESGRMTHNHPTGYLGAFAGALFMSYAIQCKPVGSWGAGLMATLPRVLKYVVKAKRDVRENKSNWGYFTDKWQAYLDLRGISDGKSEATFPQNYGVVERDAFYKSVSFDGWGGASGHDAPMIAYDAMLRARDSWSELCNGAMFHGGDSDSTAVMAGAWWGGIYGLQGVPSCNYRNLEYRERLETLAKDLKNAAESRRGK